MNLWIPHCFVEVIIRPMALFHFPPYINRIGLTNYDDCYLCLPNIISYIKVKKADSQIKEGQLERHAKEDDKTGIECS